MDLISTLIVDSNAMFLHLITLFLERHEALTVAGTIFRDDGILEQAQKLQPDVILFSLSLPSGSDLETIHRLHDTLPQTGIVALATLATENYRQAASDAGADEFIAKSALFSDLIPAIKRVAEMKRAAR